MIPDGTYAIANGIIVPSNANILFMSRNAVLKPTTPGTTVLTLNSGSVIHNPTIIAFDPAVQADSTGIKITSMSNHIVDGYLSSMNYGIVLQGTSCYFNVIEWPTVIGCKTGLWITAYSGNPAANNIIKFKKIQGANSVGQIVAGSYGILIDSASCVNAFEGGDLSLFNHSLYVDGSENKFHNVWIENCTLAPEFISGVNSANIHCANSNWAITAGARLITHVNGPSLYQDVPFMAPGDNALKALYLLNEGAGQLAHDYSGNNNHATIVGGTWNTEIGPLYGNLKLDMNSTEYISIPVAAIDFKQSFSIALLYKPISTDGDYNNTLLNVAGSNGEYLKLYISRPVQGAPDTYFKTYDGTNTLSDHLTGMTKKPDRWGWSIISYNSVAGTIANIEGVASYNYKPLTNPFLNTISTVKINEKLGGMPKFVNNYALIALWQRALTEAEGARIVESTWRMLPTPGSPEAYKVTALPTATIALRGKIYRVDGDAGVADHAYVCVKGADNNYSWVQLI